MKKCLVIGSTVCDVVIYIDKLPSSQQDIHLNNQIISVGGCAFNVVNTLHHLDIPYTFVSPIGTGIYGDFVSRKLSELNIISEIKSEEENGCCYCVVEANGDRTFMSYHKVEYTFNPQWLDNLNLDEFAYVYVCGLEVEDIDGEKLVDSLKRFKGQIVFCPGPRGNKINKELLEKIYKHKPLIHLNETEIKEITSINNLNEAILYLYSKTKNTIIVTLGGEGALFYDGIFNFTKGIKSKVIDTIGAGDSHIGAILAGLCHDKDLMSSLQFANLLSSKIVGISGVTLDQKTYEMFKSLLKS